MNNPMSTSEIAVSLDFGDYCEIEQKRYGTPNEFYRYKVIGRSSSNYYHPVPVDANGNHRAYGDMCETVKVICCGVAEDRVETFRLCDVRAIESPKAIAALQAQGAEAVAERIKALRDKFSAETCYGEGARDALSIILQDIHDASPPAQAARVPGSNTNPIADAVKHLNDWLSMDLCECEGPGHRCGATQIRNTVEGLKTLLNAAPAPVEKAMIPLNDHTRWILGRPNFTCITIANRLREMGYDIPSKAEEEQATVIHFLLTHYLNNGDQWRATAEAALRQDPAPAAPVNGEGA